MSELEGGSVLDSWDDHLHGVAGFSLMTTSRGFTNERSPGMNAKLVKKIEGLADSNVLRVIQEINQRPAYEHPQCAAGCSYCCYQWVRCTVSEAIFLFEAIKANRSAQEMAELKTAVEEYKAGWTGTVYKAPCPLLIDGLCSVYENRPLICRGTFSVDAAKCREAVAFDEPLGVPYVTPLLKLAYALREGITEGVKDVGLPSYDVVLGLALSVLLEDPEAPEKYFRGEEVFAPARAPYVPGAHD